MRLAILFLLAVAAYGQQSHSVALHWTDAPTNPAGTTYRIYRALAPCAPLPTTWVMVGQNIAAGTQTWVDNAVVPRVYCYSGTAFANTLESIKSAPAEASVPSFVPTGLLAVVAANQVNLTWTDTDNPAGSTWSVYRAPGLCSGSPSFTKIAMALAAKSYADASPPVGNVCYSVTATDNAVESAQTSGALAAVPPVAPTALTIQQVQ